jgi:hypothetical protein
MSATERNIRDLAEAVANASYAIGWDRLSRQQQATECMRAETILRTDWFANHVADRVAAARAEGARDALLSARADVYQQSGIQWGRDDWREWLRIRAEHAALARTAGQEGT